MLKFKKKNKIYIKYENLLMNSKSKVSFDTDDQSQTKIIHVINKTLIAQSTNIDGSLKELFGTNEFVYLSLSTKNANNSINKLLK